MFFFLLWPLFCSCPASLVSRNFFAVGPGCAKSFFFCCAPLGAATFRRGQSKKKKTPPRVLFFFAPAPGKGRGRRSPVPTRGQSKKKNTTQGVFFCCGPGERQGKEKPRWAPARGQSKKKKHHPGCFCFCSGPGERQGKEKPRADTGPEQKKKTPPRVFFFCCGPGERQGKEKPRWAPARGQSKKKKHHPGCFFFGSGPGERQGKEKPRADTGPEQTLPFAGAAAKKKTLGGVFFLLWPRAGTGLLLPCLSPGSEQKKTPWVVFFFALAPCRRPTGLLLPCLSPGPEQKKKHPGWCFFFCCGPARTLTHSLRAWVAMPPPRWGGVFFLLRPRPDRGGVFFFAVAPPGRSLTHCGLGRFRQGPGGVFFLLRPRRVFLDNSKKCLGYYIGSKKTRPGPQQKKKHHFQGKRVLLRNLVLKPMH